MLLWWWWLCGDQGLGEDEGEGAMEIACCCRTSTLVVGVFGPWQLFKLLQLSHLRSSQLPSKSLHNSRGWKLLEQKKFLDRNSRITSVPAWKAALKDRASTGPQFLVTLMIGQSALFWGVFYWGKESTCLHCRWLQRSNPSSFILAGGPLLPSHGGNDDFARLRLTISAFFNLRSSVR